ncbi:polysaccharide deacetylase family protein [Agriterribacter sp.]|uniref:polysaccharide deacetylase family protein n=1 Tax=Agriterribacter sp. TaxID=2821509 RepID=UPI002BFF4E77|nr:polysaccharide deacetylase family protein [Agriterribacter sp.]HRO47423.1 polysaccharide deacetylase family protein [Agriterribacter sp.]HRQ16576.1 polysaccharide deacetylase family protein [Agriterribacter sp.]
MLLIYSTYNSPRLQYIADVLLDNLSGIAVSFTTRPDEFREHEGPKINYSPDTLAQDELKIIPASLLFETGITPQNIPCKERGGYKILFPTDNGDLSFDIFAASFYLLSRYEEYLPHQPDKYGRFTHTESTAYKEGFLQQPLINYWLVDFQKSLQSKFTTLVFAIKKFRFIPTYDIDIAFSYLHKGITRNAGGLVRSLLKGELADMKERIAVLAKKKEDPFDVYEWLYALHLKYNLQPYYFFLVAASPGEYDKNVDPRHAEMRELIRYHAAGYNTGIHPSWQSGDNNELLEAEIQTLEDIIGRKVVHSRQHYIRFTLPGTYRQLIDHGILNEFSMGYGTINGFRASIASPFYWYDLPREEKTSLLVYPFCFMDANAYYEQKLTPSQAYSEIQYYHDIIKKVNGAMISIWHNNFLGSNKMFDGWKEVYELFLKEVVYWDL